MNPLEGRLIVISRLMATRDELFYARPHVPPIIDGEPTRKLALAMSLADVCSCLADEDISRSHPIKRLVRITFSAPVRRRHRAVGGPFLRAPVVSAADGYPKWLTGIERTARNRKGPCLFPLIQVNHAGARCAKRCCYIHLCPDAAGIIHQPADF
jgi:hypothetical protein